MIDLRQYGWTSSMLPEGLSESLSPGATDLHLRSGTADPAAGDLAAGGSCVDANTGAHSNANSGARTDSIPARITAVHRERYELVCQHGQTYGRLKTAVYYGLVDSLSFEEFPTVGDFVLIQYRPDGDSQIIKTLPRRSFFSRRDPTPGRGQQAVAANFDTVFVMTSLNQDFNIVRLERYLTLAWQSTAVPVVILTKADLMSSSDDSDQGNRGSGDGDPDNTGDPGDPSSDLNTLIAQAQNVAIGVEVIAVSALTRHGLDQLQKYLLPGKTVVFLGSSGVGKSSLLNALAGETLMDVSAIREDDSRGRHTTTHRQLFMLPSGAMIIDTPGMRELGMWDINTGLGEAFTDVEEILARGCRFSNCLHQTEPGCAVLTAVATGELSAKRWQGYLKLKHEAKYAENRTEFILAKQQRNKVMARKNRQKKKSEGTRR